MPVARRFAAEKSLGKLVDKAFDSLKEARIRFAIANAVKSLSKELLLAIQAALSLFGVTYLLASGEMSIGDYVAISTYIGLITSSLNSMINSFSSLAYTRMYLDRVSDIYCQNGQQDPSGSELHVEGRLEVQNVFFRYGEFEPPVLANFNLDIEPGTSVAIVGPSGCGKSTLCHMLIGLLRPTNGRILIDGLDLYDSDSKGLRAHVASVTQSDAILSSSIENNIRFFNSEISFNSVIEACKIADIHDFVDSLPQKYDTLISEQKMSLSGGQRQRILLARSIVIRPAVLILDEATSHLDVETEKKIMKRLTQIDMTLVMFAHRQETIQFCDKVIHLNGKDSIADIKEVV